MGMLDRIKKRHFEGFKEFVLNMETTGPVKRQQILMAGILEDPIFMSYVMKNVKTFDDFLNLPTDEIDTVISNQEQLIGVLAKCLAGMPTDKISEFSNSLPKFSAKLRDELSYLKEITPSENEGAKYYILKVVRKLQMLESIHGFKWELPPQELFHAKVPKDGRSKLYFETGVLAAEGDIYRGKRNGIWKHYYDSGKIMAEGEYTDGLKSSVWAFYYGSGKLKLQGRYHADLKSGLWKEWDRLEVLTESEYNEGVKKDKKAPKP